MAALRPDIAICAMPGPLWICWRPLALRRARREIPGGGARCTDPHPGDGLPLQMTLQRCLLHRADGLVALSTHVANRLREQGLADGKSLLMTTHLPLVFGPPPAPPLAHGGKRRAAVFRPAAALQGPGPACRRAAPAFVSAPDPEIRVIGNGPESEVLEALRRTPGVTVENRWVPETEIGEILAWADALSCRTARPARAAWPPPRSPPAAGWWRPPAGSPSS